MMDALAEVTAQPNLTPPVPDRDDLPACQMRIIRLRSAAELTAYLAAWQRLAEMALEPNVFYEPLALLPALECLQTADQVELLLVEANRRKNPAGPPVLCGLFPIQRRRIPGLRVSRVRLWQHLHCYLCTPLVRREVATEVLEAVLDYLASPEEDAIIWELPHQSADGPWHRLLVETLYRRSLDWWVARRHVRAYFHRASSATEYINLSMERKRRHEARRLEKRLAEQGELRYRHYQPGDDVQRWLAEFLALEAAGWKGRNATALAASERDRQYIRGVVEQAASAGRLMMLSLDLQGQPIAQKLNLLTPSGGYSLKIAFDEEYSRYSPGVLLELHNIVRLHEDGISWMDSCADPEHPMIDRLWKDRRHLETLLVATGRRGSSALLAAAPVARYLARQCGRRK